MQVKSFMFAMIRSELEDVVGQLCVAELRPHDIQCFGIGDILSMVSGLEHGQIGS